MKDTMNEQEKAMRAEAVELTPAFNEKLHARIMAAVKAEARESGAALLPMGPYRPRFRAGPWAGGIAAAVVVGVGVWMGMHKEKSVVTPSVVAVPSMKPVETMIAVPTATARERMEAGKFAYLDRDAKRFAGYVLSQLPGKVE